MVPFVFGLDTEVVPTLGKNSGTEDAASATVCAEAAARPAIDKDDFRFALLVPFELMEGLSLVPRAMVEVVPV